MFVEKSGGHGPPGSLGPEYGFYIDNKEELFGSYEHFSYKYYNDYY